MNRFRFHVVTFRDRNGSSIGTGLDAGIAQSKIVSQWIGDMAWQEFDLFMLLGGGQA